jgi:hypothetical protein
MSSPKIDKEQLTQYYRWKFLRLNPNYRSDYDFYSKEVGWINENPRISNENKSKLIREDILDKLHNKYGINGIFDYTEADLPKDLRIYGESDFAIEKGSLEDVYEGKLKNNQGIYGAYLMEKDENEIFRYKAVQVVINFDASGTDILLEIERFIERIKERRKTLKITRPSKLPLKMTKTYDIYSQIYNLRQYDKLSNVEAAIKVYNVSRTYQEFGKEFKDDGAIRMAEDKANKAFNEAKNLVETSAYRNIRF